ARSAGPPPRTRETTAASRRSVRARSTPTNGRRTSAEDASAWYIATRMVRRFSRIHAFLGAPSRDRDAVLEAISRAMAGDLREIAPLASDVETALPDAEVLVCGVAPRVDWARATGLRLLHMLGSGTETLWPARGLPPSVVVTNGRGVHLPEMRDHVLALL